MKRMTIEMFQGFVEEEVGGFKVVGDLINMNTKVTLFHEECGREFDIRPSDFKQRRSCSPCNARRKLTTEDYKKVVESLGEGSYEVLGEYVNDYSKLPTKHLVCGYSWEISPSHFKQGKRCPKCSGRVRKTPEYFRKEIWDKVGDEYEVISDYKNAHTKVSFFHNSEVCGGNVFKMTPTGFLSGKRCPACADVARSGENHWNYNPDLTEEDRMRRDMQNGEIRKWRDAVYARDEYTCQKCSVTGTKLNAHHLNSWDKHPGDRFEITNGVTLCETCHRDFHKKFGYGSNDESQFEEFTTSSPM